MIKKNLVNKEGEPLKTNEGIELVEFKFEKGDEFIPVFNKIIISEPVEFYDEKDKKTKKLVTKKLVCLVRDKDNNIISHNGANEIFVTLTTGQAKVIQNKIDKGELINQKLFTVFEYEHKEYGTHLTVGYKTELIRHKTFEEFDELNTEVRDSKSETELATEVQDSKSKDEKDKKKK